MDEFTKEEIERINTLYGTDFKDITPDDAMLIGRFEAWKAINDAEFKTRCDAIQVENEVKLQHSQEQHDVAMQTLEALRDAALARLESAQNG